MRADAYLDSLEPVGWRLGLERMRKLTTALGLPQHRFASVHVVGTNGKSSVTRMTAALLQAHGLRTGACVSPHVDRWSQRTLVQGEEIGTEAWEQAVGQVASAAEGVDRSLEEEGDAVYHEAVGHLFDGTPDPLEVIKWKELYDTLEKTLDSAEDAANVLESVTIKHG